MIRTVSKSQAEFYRGFLMRRGDFDPRDYGVDMDRARFQELMADDFAEAFHGTTSEDELLLHPRDALRFCDDIRHKHGFFDMPDDLILRSVINGRKHGG